MVACPLWSETLSIFVDGSWSTRVVVPDLRVKGLKGDARRFEEARRHVSSTPACDPSVTHK